MRTKCYWFRNIVTGWVVAAAAAATAAVAVSATPAGVAIAAIATAENSLLQLVILLHKLL